MAVTKIPDLHFRCIWAVDGVWGKVFLWKAPPPPDWKCIFFTRGSHWN